MVGVAWMRGTTIYTTEKGRHGDVVWVSRIAVHTPGEEWSGAPSWAGQMSSFRHEGVVDASRGCTWEAAQAGRRFPPHAPAAAMAPVSARHAHGNPASAEATAVMVHRLAQAMCIVQVELSSGASRAGPGDALVVRLR